MGLECGTGLSTGTQDSIISDLYNPDPLYTYENTYLYVAGFVKRDHFEYFENARFKNAHFHNILCDVQRWFIQRWFIEDVLLH